MCKRSGRWVQVEREREREREREMKGEREGVPGDGAVFTGDVSKFVLVSVTQLA